MTTNPHILPTDCLNCPSDCPFLGMRTFLPNTLPFYCNQYETFLGAIPDQKVRRDDLCRGLKYNVVSTGISFIDAYVGLPAIETKEAFLKLDHGFQKLFVDLVAKTGVQIVLPTGESDKPAALADEILKKWKEMQDKAGSPEMKEFMGILGADGMPLMSRQTKTLLMNIFQVLDNSEKDMIKHILLNPEQVKSFLDSFEKQPQDQDLLRNVRALVYDYTNKAREQERQQQMKLQNRLQREEGNRRRQELEQEQKIKQLLLHERQNTRGVTR